jgi:YjbE family integral membrane protein
VELFSNAWWSALLAIVLIDLVLAGDNAIVIALAARNVPEHLRKKTILWGTVGAIGVRTVMTLGVVWLLQIPGLMLVWVAYKLLADQGDGGHEEGGANTFWGAMKTIIVADALMGVDNVLGVAGAAHGAMDLVVIGLLVSVPIVVFGSSVVLRLVERFPWIIGVGAAVLALTAAQMIANEPWLQEFFGAAKGVVLEQQQWARWGLYAAVTAGVLLAGWRSQRRAAQLADPA